MVSRSPISTLWMRNPLFALARRTRAASSGWRHSPSEAMSRSASCQRSVCRRSRVRSRGPQMSVPLEALAEKAGQAFDSRRIYPSSRSMISSGPPKAKTWQAASGRGRRTASRTTALATASAPPRIDPEVSTQISMGPISRRFPRLGHGDRPWGRILGRAGLLQAVVVLVAQEGPFGVAGVRDQAQARVAKSMASAGSMRATRPGAVDAFGLAGQARESARCGCGSNVRSPPAEPGRLPAGRVGERAVAVASQAADQAAEFGQRLRRRRMRRTSCQASLRRGRAACPSGRSGASPKSPNTSVSSSNSPRRSCQSVARAAGPWRRRLASSAPRSGNRR